MTPGRLQLTDPELLRKLMQRAPAGRVISGKELGDHVGLSKSKVSAMLCGERTTVEPETARLIAEALGVHQGALFFEPSSTPMGMDTPHRKDSPHEHQRAVDADAPGRAPELGQHTRQGEPYRSRP